MSLSPSELAAGANIKLTRRPYTQLYNAHIRDIRQLIAVSPAAADLLFAMIEIMGKRNSLVASIATLMRISGKSKSTVIRAIALLESSNFVARLAVDTATVYCINEQVVWTDKREYRGRKMATWDAKVITFDDEQPGGVKRQSALKKLSKPPL